MRLTERVVKGLKPPPTGYKLVRDDEALGLAVRITAAGARSFVLHYTVDARERRFTIGRWPAWSVTAARERAKELRREVDIGQDPQQTKQDRRGEPTFAEVAAVYLERHASKKRTGDRDSEYLERDVLPQWGRRKAGDITRREVIELVESKAQTAPVAANRLLAVVRKLFNFAIERDLIGANPCYRVSAPTKEKQREPCVDAR